MKNILNISAYLFVGIADPQALREQVLQQARHGRLLGTVLLATEGINLFLAGEPDGVRDFLAWLRGDSRFAAIEAKESWSEGYPFRKLLVKVKTEIIRMNHPAIAPQQRRAPAVDAQTAKRWLSQGHDDEGRPVVALDTRNGFEVDHGTFEGAVDWRLDKFSDFPAALEAHKAELDGKTIVSFCTGGIRCEKAAIYMREAGLQNVWQLDGGILKYFEETGGTHFKGSCFVFDERRALDAGLRAAQNVD
ncbi:MAG: sulfurtransferase [Pseudomonadota bacterium]